MQHRILISVEGVPPHLLSDVPAAVDKVSALVADRCEEAMGDGTGP